MHLVVIGLNHKTASVDLRERLNISEDRLPDALSALRKAGAVESAILSTCNRTEVYAYTAKRSDDSIITQCIGELCGISPDSFASYLYSHAGHKAAEHLFRVAAGIDSMVVGEAQILGQVKTAYAIASRCKHTGPVLNALFRKAAGVGKRVRTETDIGRGAFSVGSAAAQLAKSIFDDLTGRTVLIVGAGKMSELAVTHLVSCGAAKVLVANRTHENAEKLAEQFGGSPVRWNDIGSALKSADIVIASTGADKPVITEEMVSSAMSAGNGRQAFFIDIAVPRDIDPNVRNLKNVFLYDIDDLQATVDGDAKNRHGEIEKIEAIIVQEVKEFTRWFRTLDAVPIVTALRDRFESIREGEFEKLQRRFPDLSPEHIEAINAATRSIVNRIAHEPMIRIKEYANEENAAEKLETARDIFGIDTSDNGKGGKTPRD